MTHPYLAFLHDVMKQHIIFLFLEQRPSVFPLITFFYPPAEALCSQLRAITNSQHRNFFYKCLHVYIGSLLIIHRER